MLFLHSIKFKKSVCHCLVILLSTGLYGQFTPNYDESKVPDYILPKLLLSSAGKQIRVTFFRNGNTLDMNILVFLPRDIEEPVPLFLGLNFNGNHTISDDPDILITESWVPNRPEWGISDNRANESSRGKSALRWPVEKIIERGYGLATIYCGDLDPDFNDGFIHGIHALYKGQESTGSNAASWGTLAAWAWGLSRALDYFKTDADVNHEKVIVFGHSRLGKAALWAGARDERFAMVISNESGCGGAALSMRRFGETVARINTQFPHWFCENFRMYNDREESLPVDQHMLLALMAPRPVYVASAGEDLWADPRGEYLSLYHAGEIYRLYGLNALQEINMPGTGKPLTNLFTGFHLRSGKHDITPTDWL